MLLSDITLDATRDFWTLLPQFKTIGRFGEFFRNNETGQAREDSSNIMWFVLYCDYPFSQYFPLSEARKVELVAKDIFPGKKTAYSKNKENIEALRAEYRKFDTPIARLLRSVYKKMDEKTVWLDTVEYDLTNFSEIDAAIKSIGVNWEVIKKVESDLKAELQVKGKGGQEASLAEKGLV